MSENFNRQFIIVDFKHLDDPAYLEFVGTPEFKVFLILMRYVWRGGTHRLALDELHVQKKLLVAAIQRDFIANKLCITDATRVSKYLKRLEDMNIIQRMRTGRESIFVVGEWIDISEEQDGSSKKEWFYYERVFGKNKSNNSFKETREGSDKELLSDVAPNTTSEVQKTPHQTWRESPPQMWHETLPSNIYKINNKNNTVNVNGISENEKTKTPDEQAQAPDKTDLRKLPDLNLPKEQAQFMVKTILEALGDTHSQNFYYLVSSKIPERYIRKTLSEIKQDGARFPERVFAHRMKTYAEEELNLKTRDGLFDLRKSLADSKKLA